MNHVRLLRARADLTPAATQSILDLTHKIWPPAPEAPPPDFARVLSDWRAQNAAHFVISENGVVVAHAEIFPREIITTRGPITVGALASVCVHPDYRGRGWGAEVVREAFAYLPKIKVEVALFQTGVPQFYEKLGCRLIDNRFHNNGDYQDVFWDDYKVIYPADFAWPEGEIDLNGPGY